MKTASPVTFGIACATGVFASNYFAGSGDLQTSLLAGGISGGIVATILYFWSKRRG